MKKINLATIATGMAMVTLMGCKTAPTRVVSPLDNPSLAGSCMVTETTKCKAKVQSMDTAQRRIVLANKEGALSCKAGPDAHIALLKVGDQVKATVLESRAIFLTKSGAPPNPGAGVKVADAPEWSSLKGTVLQTVDLPAKVLALDSSYRMLKIKYDDGRVKEFKADLNFPLEEVKDGDKIIVRQIEGVITQIKLL